MNEAYLCAQNVYTVLEYKPLPGLHTYIDLIQAERMTRKRETLENSSNSPQAHNHSYKEFHSLRHVIYTQQSKCPQLIKMTDAFMKHGNGSRRYVFL
jgi:hypothetical protein